MKALGKRVNERVKSGSLLTAKGDLLWYYPAAEYLSDAAMLYALKPEKKLAKWIRGVSLKIAGTPDSDWVGPSFRDHSKPFTGHLETAHICWGISAVLDLAGDALSKAEKEKISNALLQKGILLCERWLQNNSHLANWRGIMASGVLVASAVLNDKERIERHTATIAVLCYAFQPDGSYGESLQYGNYLANALMIAYEALVRKYPEQAAAIQIDSYASGMQWVAQSMLYRKPLGGAWGKEPRARAVNFNDSAAIFRSSGDLLLHVAARYKKDKTASGLARWLFAEYYESCPDQGPHDLATFGMRNDWGFLTLPLLCYSARPISPERAGLPLTAAFSNGNTLVRDRWNGNSVLAIQGGNNDGCYAPGHLQGDLNSFMLSYKKERLLADAGHSCYRNIIHGLESATQTHNTCTFLLEHDKLGLQEDIAKIKLLEQKNVLPRRLIINGQPGEPIERGGRLLTAQRLDDVSLVVSEAAASYGEPIHEFTRCWLQIGPHITLVTDRIRAEYPVKTVWNWMVNNRDNKTEVVASSRLLFVKRKDASLLLHHLGTATGSGPVYAHLHDAYHVEPNRLGEGASGTGLLYRFTGQASGNVFCKHLLIADDSKEISTWKMEPEGNIIHISQKGTGITIEFGDKDRLNMKVITGKNVYVVQESESKIILKNGK